MPYNPNSLAILKTNTKINPSSPESAEFYDREQVAYVIQRENGNLIVATSFGSLSISVDSYRDFHHDQSGKWMGNLKIVGVVTFATGESQGVIPDKLVPHFVFK